MTIGLIGWDIRQILRAIHLVAAGESYISPTLASFLLAADAHLPAEQLTARERRVLALLARGERDLDIAAHLNISIRTVRSHLERIRDKTGRRRALNSRSWSLSRMTPPPVRDVADPMISTRTCPGTGAAVGVSAEYTRPNRRYGHHNDPRRRPEGLFNRRRSPDIHRRSDTVKVNTRENTQPS